MKTLLKSEELFQFLFAIYLNSLLPFSWWWYWVWFLAPDVGFIGYAVNTKVGAWTYNILHHKGFALILYVAGLMSQSMELQCIGLLLFGHSAFDRLVGYGLKHFDSFQHTHLGWVGKSSV
jgi:hypothetical protein